MFKNKIHPNLHPSPNQFMNFHFFLDICKVQYLKDSSVTIKLKQKEHSVSKVKFWTISHGSIGKWIDLTEESKHLFELKQKKLVRIGITKWHRVDT